MEKFHIHKKSRLSGPYAGPACNLAGVQPGKVYDSRDLAQKDADRLTACNPVGFEVSSNDYKLPSDYECCGVCGFDHAYEPNEAQAVHDKLDRQDIDSHERF